MRLTHEVPHEFEIYSEIPCSVSTESRSFYFIVKDSLSYFIDSTEKEDIMNIKYDKTHNFTGYEIMRCSKVLKSIWHVFDKYETEKLKMTQKDLDGFQVLKPYLEKLHNLTRCFKNQVNAEEDKSVLWESAQKVVTECKVILREINKLRLLEPKCRYLEWTDAGPGVGVTNHDVQFRTAQEFRIINADCLIRLHLANGDSAQNEVERCQGYVGGRNL